MVSVETIEQMRAAIEAGADGVLFGGDSYHHQPITPNDYQKMTVTISRLEEKGIKHEQAELEAFYLNR